MKEEFLLDNQLCFRLYTASRLLTQAYHPLLSQQGLTSKQLKSLEEELGKKLFTRHSFSIKLTEEGILLRTKGKKDARQMIVSLTAKGKMLQEKLSDVPMTLGKAVLCGSVTPESAPSLFTMLDDIIGKLSEPTPVKK